MTAAPDTAQPQAAAAIPDALRMIPVRLKIRRFNPETDTEPHWEVYEVQCLPT